jgi:U3 small nucleolar RNA-associated protein 20
VNDTFSALKHGKRNALKQQQTDKEPTKQVEMQSCLIIPSEAKRGGDKPKVHSRTNQHVIVEFALNLLNNLIKQNRLAEVSDFVKMLDPYLQVFVEYLDGKYLKVTIITIRCLIGMLKHPLPSLEVHSKQIANKLFVLLRTYSSSSTNESERGDNFELLMVCYKLISNLIRDCAHFNLNDEQLQVLLHYAERNLYDNYKQASAFNLLKSILSRKFQCEELNDVLGKVMKLSIQAESVTVRLQSRQTMLQYMLNYALTEKKLIKLIEFYVVQLDYEYESGRESALEMLATMFETFPTVRLTFYFSLKY